MTPRVMEPPATRPICWRVGVSVGAWQSLRLGLVLLAGCAVAACDPGKDACHTTLDCLEGYRCSDGRCFSVDGTGSCDPRWAGEDGCDAFSICSDVSQDGSRTAEYRCVNGGGCPWLGSCGGSAGGVCNNGLVAEKERVCLQGRCTASSECERGQLCAFLLDNRLGLCQDGFEGQICNGDEDCDIVSYCSGEDGEGVGQCSFGIP